MSTATIAALFAYLCLAWGALVWAEKQCNGENTQLHLAALHGDFEEVKSLLNNDATDVNAENMRCDTPLHYAAQNGHAKIVEILLRAKADPAIENIQGKTPIDLVNLSSENTAEKLAVLKLLLNNGAKPTHDRCLADFLVLAIKTDYPDIELVLRNYY